MKQKYSDMLFALYINGGQATMDWLVDFLGGGEAPRSQEIHRNIGALASAKLVTMFIEQDQVYVSLTEDGNRAALAAADILSGKMIKQWQTIQVA